MPITLYAAPIRDAVSAGDVASMLELSSIAQTSLNSGLEGYSREDLQKWLKDLRSGLDLKRRQISEAISEIDRTLEDL